ncbi:RagB/SusD family nutrient uptake outer membrane protein [Pedobacter mucosus]|uniref:RagB/SusD family nutrient uptake outer membrane protein n=1 Tax=Pedobacter mucosus TaxID=2895286 RepID=UPI001EE3FB05|nr:RagB/SusD family nutrient uptake outer membrane protein [Pedobacter mucosus]UKT65936.1 RagB/SusD family nutrient uptake outer membrane protein [Pedobacter mucosus]
MAFSSCKKDYLSFDYTDGTIREEDVWNSDRNSRGFLNTTYAGLINSYNVDNDGALLASASDEAVNSNANSAINIINNGTWGALRTIDDQYSNMYTYIRKTNLFLEKSANSAITPATDIPKLKGEAYFLRAMYHFELMKRYGAVILATRSYTTIDDLDVPKNTVDQVVAQITADCDEAIKVLPESQADWGAADKGRATAGAALALKSRALLYVASPLYNPTGEISKWASAAAAAKQLIDLNKNSLLTVAQLASLWDFSVAASNYSREVIFATNVSAVNSIESNNAPISYDGAKGRTNPTQELVNAFEMKVSGKPITDNTSGYSATDPYSTIGASARDPRLALFVIYNGQNFKSRAVETFVGGKDNVPTNVNNTKTGYYMRKFLSESAAWATGTGSTVVNRNRPWIFFRYSEILLNYAEALNEASGPVIDVYTYINLVRNRAGMPNLPIGLTQSQMRDRIQNERRVELCFEGHRFFDVRRWKKGADFLNKPVSGMQITKTGTTLTYTPFTVESRIFTDKNYFFPIPQAEMNKVVKLTQNPGY